MRPSPVAIVLFAVVFAVLLYPLLQALLINIQSGLASVPQIDARSDVDLGRGHLKTLSDWLFAVLTSPMGLIILVALGLTTYAAAQAVKPR
jgi:hypothetical protein